jgi:Na+-transporting NADH:ubiquinone oxidoreductase subunit D
MSDLTTAAVLKKNLWTENPIFVQILGICSTLAVTNNLSNTIIMTAAVMIVTGLSSTALSLIKSMIPRKVRMIVQTVVIAFFVILVDIVLRAFVPDVSRALGPYVGLIITNCIIMGRAEAFAQSNPPLLSLWDGLTSGAGYMAVLVVIAIIRELLGSGSLLGFPVFGEGFTKWTIMVMPASAFFLLGGLIWAVKTIMSRKEAS